ncbi:MAG: hypothetical protein JST43_08180 [Bacteroidetes bacterium]|nr:hypothetical protein [Bacteroidota bacterium]MBS1541566.1 hypothetical protein [Bacteroidota bacterium]
MKYSLCLLILFFFTAANAQNDWVALFKGDTIRGEARILSYDKIDRVQILHNGKKTAYPSTQVKSLKMDDQLYRAVRYDNSIRMMKQIKDGYLSLLAFNSEGQGNLWNSQYLLKRDGQGMEVPNLAFKKLLSKFLGDCPEIKDRFEKGDFTKRDMERIVDFYNACLEAKTRNTPAPTAALKEADINKLTAIKQFSSKLEAETFPSKKDVIDLLKDMEEKISHNEAIPNYLGESLKSLLKDQPALLSATDELLKQLR